MDEKQYISDHCYLPTYTHKSNNIDSRLGVYYKPNWLVHTYKGR